MRKEAVCVLVVLLGGGWALAQNTPPGGAFPASAGPAPTVQAAASGNGAVTPVNYMGGGGYPNGYAYPPGPAPGYGDGAFPAGYAPGASYGAGYNFAYGTGYPAGFDPTVPADAADNEQGPTLPTRTAVCYTWANISYIAAWMKHAPLSTPLVSTGSASDPHPGAIGQPGTAVVFGDNNIDFGLRQGIAGEFGVFLDPDHHLDIDAAGFYFFPQHVNAVYSSDASGNPVITRPVFNTMVGQDRSFLTAFPNVVAGTTSIDSRSSIWGYEVNTRYHVCPADGVLIDCLLGYRQARLDERILITDQLTPLVSNDLTFLGANNFVNPPNRLTDYDLFGTSNIFYGVNFGARIRWLWDWGFLNVYAKAAVGVTSEKVNIQGATSLITPTNTTTTTGGILALPSNIGSYHRSAFAVIPETGFTIGYDPIKHVRLIAGYSFMFWSNVVRPGQQIDRNVNPAQVPTDVNYGTGGGTAGPLFSFHQSNFWMQTINAGVEFYY